MAIAGAEAQFRSEDSDKDGSNDFWIRDLSGLHRIKARNSSKAIALIEDTVALADASPCQPLDKEGAVRLSPDKVSVTLCALGAPKPRNGYWYLAMESQEVSPGEWVKYDSGSGRNRSLFGFCAYPAEYPKDGKLTYITNADCTIWRKDTGGKAVKAFPASPSKEGWARER